MVGEGLKKDMTCTFRWFAIDIQSFLVFHSLGYKNFPSAFMKGWGLSSSCTWRVSSCSDPSGLPMSTLKD